MYAVVESGGKQHRVAEGDLIQVEKIDGDVGTKVSFDRVLLLAGGEGQPRIGAPYVDGASVAAEVVRQGRGKKVIVYKKKPNKQYQRRKGHRQEFTQLKITGIAG